MFSRYRNFALDLGTVNTVLYAPGRGVVFDEPSVVVVQHGGSAGVAVVAVGAQARPLVGRSTPKLSAVRPLRDGVIGDFHCAEALIRYALRGRVWMGPFSRARLIVGVPSGATPVERRAISESALGAGVSRVYLVDEGVAAAIGANLDVFDPTGSMVVDIGGGTTEVTAFSSGSVAHSASVRFAGDKMDDAIIGLIKRKFNTLIGEQTAEAIKIELGVATMEGLEGEGPFAEVIGRDLVTGKPKPIIVGRRAIFEALQEPISEMLSGAQVAIESVSAELVSDLSAKGIILTGGGALLKNIDKLFSSFVEMPVFIADDPLRCVARGLGKIVENMSVYQGFIEEHRK